MIVLIDAGNTRIKLGWIMPNGLREPKPAALQHADLARMAQWLHELPAAPVRGLGVNVAGGAVAQAVTAQLEAFGCPVDWITSASTTPDIVNAYEVPVQLGADRWVSLIGLAQHARTHAPLAARNTLGMGRAPLMLASFGTATTIDTLMPDISRELRSPDIHPPWIFQGGVIFPGPSLMRSSLVTGTANLPEACGEAVAYPRNTHAAIATGIAAAQAGAVLRQWLTGFDHYGQAPQVYSAGGAWPLVAGEAQRLLASTQIRMRLPATPVKWLSSPILDGLAGMATSAA